MNKFIAKLQKKREEIYGRRVKGVALIEKVILLALALFILAFILPPALTAIATSALTSVNTAVQTLFQLVVSIVAVIGVVLLIYYGVVERSGGSL